jgi:proline iminopeptidase
LGDRIDVRGKKIHVEFFGKENSIPLLYIHGGPGAGSYDFELFQNVRLSENLYLITFDQRGVLRSDSFLENENFELNDLIEDCEALRITLGISRWSVLGHSFGGYIALLYSIAYPSSIEKLILESPSFDLRLSARSLILGAALEYIKSGDEEQATICKETSVKEGSPEEIFNLCFNQILNELGDRRENLYTYGPDKFFFDRIVSEAPFPKEWWRKQQVFQKKLFDEGAIYQSIIPILQRVECSSLLIKGAHDYVTCDIQVRSFLTDVKNSQFKLFNNSGHMPHFEEPEVFAETVIQFLLGDFGGKGLNSHEN